MQKDGRADWCNLTYLHGPHGAKAKGGACPGGPNLVKATATAPKYPGERATRKVVENSVKWLNGKLKEIGSPRWYEFAPGGASTQQRHKLLEFVPDMVGPAREEVVGRTYAEALKYVNAMNHALSGVVSDRRRARNAALNGH